MHDLPSGRINMSPRIWLATLLKCNETEITEHSSILNHPSWDSMAHVQIMLYLEENYGVEMNEESIQHYGNFSAIQELHDSRS